MNWTSQLEAINHRGDEMEMDGTEDDRRTWQEQLERIRDSARRRREILIAMVNQITESTAATTATEKEKE
jgi:DNA-binding transcriptional MocR family regulator